MYLYVCEKMRNPAWESIIKHIVLPGCLTSFSCAVLAFFVIAMHCFMQRENRLRGTFITYYPLQSKFSISSACKPKSENPLFFSLPPMPLEIELLPWGVIPWGPKYAQEP